MPPLLRRVSNASGSALLLASATLALVPVAAAGTPAPDPSPAGAGITPDPYLVPAPPTKVVHTYETAVPPAAVTPPRVPKAPVVRAKAKRPAPVTASVSPAKPVPQLVRPSHSLVARVAAAVAPRPRVSHGVAIAVACLVLLSGVLIAGAAREVAR
jgi:hypothetical protein